MAGEIEHRDVAFAERAHERQKVDRQEFGARLDVLDLGDGEPELAEDLLHLVRVRARPRKLGRVGVVGIADHEREALRRLALEIAAVLRVGGLNRAGAEQAEGQEKADITPGIGHAVTLPKGVSRL